MGKRSLPRRINHHASSRLQAVRACSAPHLPFGFAWKPSLSVPWAQGLLSAFWIWGYLDLPACGPPRGSIDGLVRPNFNKNTTRPSRGAKPRQADDAKTPEGSSLLRRAPDGRGFLCKIPHEAQLT